MRKEKPPAEPGAIGVNVFQASAPNWTLISVRVRRDRLGDLPEEQRVRQGIHRRP